jgi:hypothetical protein
MYIFNNYILDYFIYTLFNEIENTKNVIMILLIR